MRTLKQALLCFSLVLVASEASAAVIDLEPPTGPYLGHVYSQDGYTFTNSVDNEESYFNWKGIGATDYDADFPGSTLDQGFADTTNTITKTAGGSFFFGGISLADVYNSTSGGTVDFTFNYGNGTSSSVSVALAMKSGLQAFAFNQPGVTSVAITTDPNNPGNSHYLQFDYLVVDTVSSVPLPASLPMFGGALLALAGFGYGLNRRTGQKGGTATAA